MSDNCKQVTTPEVDNSILTCEEYMNALCVIYEKTAPFIGITTDDKSVTEVIDAIVSKLQTQSVLITNLETLISEVEGVSYNAVSTAVPYTVLNTVQLVMTNGADITMFDATTILYPVTIKNIGITNIDIIAAGADTIEGLATLQLIPNASVTLYPNLTDFKVI